MQLELTSRYSVHPGLMCLALVADYTFPMIGTDLSQSGPKRTMPRPQAALRVLLNIALPWPLFVACSSQN